LSVDYDKLNKERLRSASHVVKQLDLDALVATAFDNVRYLTGRRAFFVTGWEPNAVAILTKEGEVFFQHADEYVAPSPLWRNKAETLRKQRLWFNYSTFNPTIVSDMWVQWLVKTLDKIGVKKGRIGLDRSPWQWYAELRNKRPDLEIVDAEEDLLLARAVKNSEEVKLLKKAGKVAAKGVEAGIKALKPGIREYEVYKTFMGVLYGEGSEGDGFFPFLTSGPCVEGALYPVNRKLKNGDPVIIDIGPIIEGYNGDCMRTGFVGRLTKEFKELYKAVYDCMYAAIKNVRPGVRVSELSEISRKVLRERGYDEPPFDYGHGLGLNCCELPVLMRKEAYENVGRKDIELKPNMFFTCEPRLYKMVGGKTFLQCSLEESIMVTESGRQVITPAPFIDEIID